MIWKKLTNRNKRETEKQNELLAQLEAAVESQKQFVSHVSHELRTPLAAVIGQLDLALQKERTPEQYRAAIEASLIDARRIAKILDGLLNLAKADYQKDSIRMQEIRLDELLLDVRQNILKSHPDYHVELVFDFIPDVLDNIDNIDKLDKLEHSSAVPDDDRQITVLGNEYLLSIAFANLIENNCKYSSDQTSLVHISFWEEHAILRFSDCGAGMNKDDREKIFNLFYRGSMQQSTNGHGIGMTLAQKIILMHSGKISVHTQEGEGTTFVVELPHI